MVVGVTEDLVEQVAAQVFGDDLLAVARLRKTGRVRTVLANRGQVDQHRGVGGAQRRQRRAQLVRDVGDPLLARLLRRLQRGGHVVEGIGELGEFVVAARGQTHAVVALRHRGRAFAEHPQAPRQPARDQRGVEQHGGEHAQRNRGKGAGLLREEHALQRGHHLQPRHIAQVTHQLAVDLDGFEHGLFGAAFGSHEQLVLRVQEEQSRVDGERGGHGGRGRSRDDGSGVVRWWFGWRCTFPGQCRRLTFGCAARHAAAAQHLARKVLPALTVVGDPVPVAVQAVALGESHDQGLQPGLVCLVQVLDQAFVKAPAVDQVGRHDQHHVGTCNRQEELDAQGVEAREPGAGAGQG